MLILYEVISRIMRHTETPAKRVSRGRRRLYAILRYANGVMIAGGLFGLTIALLHSELLFILLPTGVSIAVTAVTMRSRVSTLRALLLTACLALTYFAFITGWELFTHPTTTSKIVLVTTTLTIAVILEPLRALAQSFFEQRFHVLDDTMSKTIDAFTSALREEIDLDQVRDHFFDVVQTTMQPRFVSMWVRAPARQKQEPAERQSDHALPSGESPLVAQAAGEASSAAAVSSVAVSEDDPLVTYIVRHPGALEVARLPIESPAVHALKTSEAELALPLVSQGELIGLLALGPRADGDEYTREDRRLLASLAAQAAPALRVSQMVRAQAAEVRERERIEQELRTAQQIQRTFLPKEVPVRPGWELIPYYRPAREVGGDFYDFLPFADGRLGLVIGDVTGKGIPAALVMTAARTMLRTAAQEEAAPGAVLARVNDLLNSDIPSGMFVTSFYAVLDPITGGLWYANAGQDLPYVRRGDGTVGELRATGVPLGLLPDSRYDEEHATLGPGDSLLFYSDGLVEAHNPQREMFGLPRVLRLMASHADGAALIAAMLDELQTFVGAGWEQEDDVTLVTLRREADEAERGATERPAARLTLRRG